MHARGRELTKERSPSTHEEVIVDALLLTRELIAGGGLCRQRGRSQWEDQSQGKVAVERGICHIRINTLSTSSSSSFGRPIPQEDHRRRELREIQIKLEFWELCRLVAMSTESFFVSFFLRFGSFVVATVGSRMRINLGLASPNFQHTTIYILNYWIGFEFS